MCLCYSTLTRSIRVRVEISINTFSTAAFLWSSQVRNLFKSCFFYFGSCARFGVYSVAPSRLNYSTLLFFLLLFRSQLKPASCCGISRCVEDLLVAVIWTLVWLSSLSNIPRIKFLQYWKNCHMLENASFCFISKFLINSGVHWV